MAEEKFSLFDSGASEIILPSADEDAENTAGIISEKDIQQRLKDTNDLISEGLERAIRGETVKSMMIPEDINILLPNYVIDFTDLTELYEFQMEAMDALLHPEGEVTLYVYTKSGLAKLGRGKSSILDRILSLSLINLFDSKCKLYRDFQPGKPLVTISQKDITTMRLSI